MEGGARRGASPCGMFTRILAVALCVVVMPRTHGLLVKCLHAPCAAPFAYGATEQTTLVSPRLRLNSMRLRDVRVAGRHCQGPRRRTQTRMQDKGDVDRVDRREAIEVSQAYDRFLHARSHTDHDPT